MYGCKELLDEVNSYLIQADPLDGAPCPNRDEVFIARIYEDEEDACRRASADISEMAILTGATHIMWRAAPRWLETTDFGSEDRKYKFAMRFILFWPNRSERGE